VSAPSDEHTDVVPFRSALRAWFAISLQTFGGPAGQIAVMQRALVDDRRWISQRRFSHALSYCMLLPGPEAHQLAIYVGWLLNGLRGGLAAGVLFVLPGMLALLVLSAIYVAFGATTAVSALFTGLGAAVIAIVAQALVRVAGRALTHPVLVAVAVAAFVALAVFGVPFPAVIAVAALVGWLAARRARSPRRRATAPPTAARPRWSPTTRCMPKRRPRPGRHVSSPSGSSRGRPRSPWSPSSPAPRASTPHRACSSRAPRSSRSAAHTPCSRSSRSRPCRPTAGSPRGTWSAASHSPRRPLAH
jgi:chromate transport protein ChrA